MKNIVKSFCRTEYGPADQAFLREIFEKSEADLTEYILRSSLHPQVLDELLLRLRKHWSKPFLRQTSEATITEMLDSIVELQHIHSGPVNFTGSVAYFHRDFIQKYLQSEGVRVDKIVQYPMTELIDKYGKQNK